MLSSARQQGASEIKKVKLKVGEGMAVVPECVRFYFDTIKKGTLARSARLEVETVPLRLVCPKCRTEVRDFVPSCRCQAGAEVVSGQELLVEYIEIETGPARPEVKS